MHPRNCDTTHFSLVLAPCSRKGSVICSWNDGDAVSLLYTRRSVQGDVSTIKLNGKPVRYQGVDEAKLLEVYDTVGKDARKRLGHVNVVLAAATKIREIAPEEELKSMMSQHRWLAVGK